MEPVVIQEGTLLDSKEVERIFPNVKLQSQLIDYQVLKVNSKGLKQVSYVGVITWENYVFLFMPKVWQTTDKEYRGEGIRLIVQILRKYSQDSSPTSTARNYKEASFFNVDSTKSATNRLALSDGLMKDYLEYGLYQRKETIHKKNGKGQINWPKTVNQSAPYFSKGRPIYLDYTTYSKRSDNANILKQLHFFVINQCISQWVSILGYEEFSIDHEPVNPIDKLPDKAYIKAILQSELGQTYSDRETKLIQMLSAWFHHHEHESKKTLSLYGTSSFHTVWEKACSDIFNNELGIWKEFIPKPRWTTLGMSNEVEKHTLRPDIVCSLRENLIIIDAKYYKLKKKEKGKLGGNPGVGDVIKQMFYEYTLKPKAEERGYKRLYNYFLFPGETDQLLLVDGYVSLDVLDTQPICLIYMNPEKVFRMYLTSSKISSELLDCMLPRHTDID